MPGAVVNVCVCPVRAWLPRPCAGCAFAWSADKRYKRVGDIPDTVLSSMEEDKVFSPGFSIKGESVEGRPAYLDFQVRLPLRYNHAPAVGTPPRTCTRPLQNARCDGSLDHTRCSMLCCRRRRRWTRVCWTRCCLS